MKKTAIAFLMLLIYSFTVAQTITRQKPKLVVFIAVEGLKKEHIALIYPHLREGGFRRIIERGAYFPNNIFNYVAKNSISDIASIITASTPANNGIISDRILNREDNKFISIVEDRRYKGIYSSIGRSPINLMNTTFGDMAKIYDKESKVIAIGINPQNAIIMAGHNANSALWIDDEMTIGSSDFYGRMPIWAINLNYMEYIKGYAIRQWRPLYSLHTYRYNPYNTQMGNFYIPQKNSAKKELVENMRYTPAANFIVNEMAQKAIIGEEMGQDNKTDIMYINFNVNTIFNKTAEINSAQKEDLYLNLDIELESLLCFIDQNVNIEQTLIVMTGTQVEPMSQNSIEENRLETGKFNAKRAMALLNAFLMAKYGQARWILNYREGNIYINNSEIEKREIDRDQFYRNIINFVSNIKGVSLACTAYEITATTGEVFDVRTRIRNSFYRDRSGDVIIMLRDGWVDMDTDEAMSDITSTALQFSPVAFYGLNIKESYDRKIYSMMDIATTIADIMQIPRPSQACGTIFNIDYKTTK